MHLGQDLREVAVALVGDDDRGPGLGDEEIGAGDADVGGEELFAQDVARLGEHMLGLSDRSRSRGRCRCALRKSASTSLARDVDRRRDDVRRRLVAQLDDVFAEIGLDRLDAVRLERLVEADLLGDHRLALGDALGAARRAEVEEDLPRLRRVARLMHVAAGLGHLALVGLEIEVEMRERVVLDVAGAVAQRLELRQPLGGGGAARHEIAGACAARAAAARLQRLVDVLLEVRRGRTRRSSRRLLASPIGGIVGHAGQHFGDMANPHRAGPRAASCPAMFIRQPRSPASSVSAPVAAIVRALLGDDRVRELAVFDREGAAEAAADVAVLQARRAAAPRRSPAACAAARARRARAAPSRNRDRSRRLRSAHRPWSRPACRRESSRAPGISRRRRRLRAAASGSSANSSG